MMEVLTPAIRKTSTCPTGDPGRTNPGRRRRLGGVLTPTGLGTPVADGKQIITVDGRPYLLELPLRADVALISGYRALVYISTAR